MYMQVFLERYGKAGGTAMQNIVSPVGAKYVWWMTWLVPTMVQCAILKYLNHLSSVPKLHIHFRLHAKTSKHEKLT
jgi:hypothetical protein